MRVAGLELQVLARPYVFTVLDAEEFSFNGLRALEHQGFGDQALSTELCPGFSCIFEQ
jgi:hypothetical protein